MDTQSKPTTATPPVVKHVVPTTERGAVRPADIDGAWRLCQALAKSSLLPASFTEKAGRGSAAAIQFSMDERVANVFLAVQMGAEVGLTAMQSIQSIAVINNRPSLWGDGLIGVVRASGICELIEETIKGDGDQQVARCETRRSDTGETIIRTFSVEDAKAAGLWPETKKNHKTGEEYLSGKGPWQNYPKRMLAMRARSWCLRDAYADVLKGLYSADELTDMGTLEAQADGTYTTTPAERPRRQQSQPETVDPAKAGHEDLDAKFADTVTDAEIIDQETPEPQEPATTPAEGDAKETANPVAADENPKEKPSSPAPGATDGTPKALIASIKKTKTLKDLDDWEQKTAGEMDALYQTDPDGYQAVKDAFDERLDAISNPAE